MSYEADLTQLKNDGVKQTQQNKYLEAINFLKTHSEWMKEQSITTEGTKYNKKFDEHIKILEELL